MTYCQRPVENIKRSNIHVNRDPEGKKRDVVGRKLIKKIKTNIFKYNEKYQSPRFKKFSESTKR